MTATTDAAAQASATSGLPYALTLALIQAEQSDHQLLLTNNPFDITTTWLSDTGHGNAITGTWNSVGVATVSDISTAIASWWAGVTSFSLYKQFRADLAAGASIQTLVNDLGATGYAGSDWGGWATNVVNLYNQNSGTPAPPSTSSSGGSSGAATGGIPANISVGGQDIPTGAVAVGALLLGLIVFG